jgi:hypothetical protein
LQSKLASANSSLDSAVQRAQQRVGTLTQEAAARAESLELHLSEARCDVKARIEDRMKRVKGAYHARGAKLAQAWKLTKEALTSKCRSRPRLALDPRAWPCGQMHVDSAFQSGQNGANSLGGF